MKSRSTKHLIMKFLNKMAVKQRNHKHKIQFGFLRDRERNYIKKRKKQQIVSEVKMFASNPEQILILIGQ